MHLPRSVFSQRQLELFLWLLRVNGVDDVPSVRTMVALNAALQKLCGIETIEYLGKHGHRYYVNDISQIIAQVRVLSIIMSVRVVDPIAGNRQPQDFQLA